MKIHAGYQIAFDCLQPMPILLKLSVHPDRRGDLLSPDEVRASVPAPISQLTDEFGNLVTRVSAPAGQIVLSSRFIIEDSGEPDRQNWDARQIPVEDLPAEAIPFLLASRYCETDLMSNLAWSLFGATKPGWQRVQAIVDYAHQRIQFGYRHARPTRTALEGHQEQVGVCRDYAHLAVTLCRAMNIPARYCNGYLGDIGVPYSDAPMDFSAWFEVYLEGGWHTFDARHNAPRIGRIVIARGRDAADVAMTHTFGQAWLTEFKVITDEVTDAPQMVAA
ncbi:transglutaminase-like domain-containing protein [Phenylobacterium immobile]|uniref:transglutaminase-like domain-containing protein n=1 Tax=Phenylobacterium immobile TaxID=21 RepID=UPI000AC6A1F2|nr:transglutaminase family protein [Phenylobacterium immobile]